MNAAEIKACETQAPARSRASWRARGRIPTRRQAMLRGWVSLATIRKAIRFWRRGFDGAQGGVPAQLV